MRRLSLKSLGGIATVLALGGGVTSDAADINQMAITSTATGYPGFEIIPPGSTLANQFSIISPGQFTLNRVNIVLNPGTTLTELANLSVALYQHAPTKFTSLLIQSNQPGYQVSNTTTKTYLGGVPTSDGHILATYALTNGVQFQANAKPATVNYWFVIENKNLANSFVQVNPINSSATYKAVSTAYIGPQALNSTPPGFKNWFGDPTIWTRPLENSSRITMAFAQVSPMARVPEPGSVVLSLIATTLAIWAWRRK